MLMNFSQCVQKAESCSFKNEFEVWMSVTETHYFSLNLNEFDQGSPQMAEE